MKWHQLIGFVGAVVIAATFGRFQVLALPAEEVTAKLQPIPVFAITNEQGKVWTVSNQENIQLPVFFISLADAQKYQRDLENKKPELKDKLSVTLISLGEAYQKVKAEDERKEFLAAFVPMEQQVNLAEQLLKQQGQEVEQFQGVPLFFPTVIENQQEGYLIIKVQRENSSLEGIPFFFEQGQLQKLIEQVQQQRGENQPAINIKVIPLEALINILEKESDEAIKSIILFRSQESEEFIRKIQEEQQQ